MTTVDYTRLKAAESGRLFGIPIESTWPPEPTPTTDPTRPADEEADPDQSTRPMAEVDSTPDPTPATRPDPDDGADSTPVDSTDNDGRPRHQSRPDPTARQSASPTGSTRPDSGRDWVVDLGLAVGGIAAIVASFETLKHLAHLVGWGRLDWLLPLTLDTFVITATRVWLSRRTKSRKVRHFARNNAIGAIALSLAGNATYHAIGANAWHPSDKFWLLVVAVSSVPPLAIGLISHLAVLRTQDDMFAATESTQPTRLSTGVDSTPDPLESTESGTPRPEESGEESTPSRRPTPTQERSGGVARPDSGEPGKASPKKPAPARRPQVDSALDDETDESTVDPDPLLPRSRELDQEYRETKGKPIGAEPLREALRAEGHKVGAKRSRSLRDKVHGLHLVDPTLEATG